MNSTAMIQCVHIQLERVQTWLFAVPRLRAMVGANALLGEALREAVDHYEATKNGSTETAGFNSNVRQRPAAAPHASRDGATLMYLRPLCAILTAHH